MQADDAIVASGMDDRDVRNDDEENKAAYLGATVATNASHKEAEHKEEVEEVSDRRRRGKAVQATPNTSAPAHAQTLAPAFAPVASETSVLGSEGDAARPTKRTRRGGGGEAGAVEALPVLASPPSASPSSSSVSQSVNGDGEAKAVEETNSSESSDSRGRWGRATRGAKAEVEPSPAPAVAVEARSRGSGRATRASRAEVEASPSAIADVQVISIDEEDRKGKQEKGKMPKGAAAEEKQAPLNAGEAAAASSAAKTKTSLKGRRREPSPDTSASHSQSHSQSQSRSQSQDVPAGYSLSQTFESSAAAGSEDHRSIRVMATGLVLENFEQNVRVLGGVAVTDPMQRPTHLVAASAQRTVKLMCAMSTCKYIVTPAWFTDSVGA